MAHRSSKDAGDDNSGIPEFGNRRTPADAFTDAAKGVVNAFTVERDTSLADGAGAPGSTAVGGLARDEENGDARNGDR